MRSLFIFLLSTFLLMADTFAQDKPVRLQEVNGTKQLTYAIKQKAIQKSAYSMFESIYVNYPEFLSTNKIAHAPLNALMANKALKEIYTESFKFSFLPFAYEALGRRLGKNRPRNWQGYALETGSPTIEEIKTQILFYSGDVMGYQVLYRFSFEPSNELKVEGMHYVRTFYFQLSTGKELSLQSLIAPAKWNALWQLIEQGVQKNNKEERPYIQQFSWDNGSELRYNNYGDDSEEEDDNNNENKTPKHPPLIRLQASDKQHFYLNITPYAVQFILPPFCSSFETMKQLGIVVTLLPNEFNQFLPPNSLLGSRFEPKKTTSLQHIHIEQKQLSGFYQLINPLHENSFFDAQGHKGYKQQELYSVTISAKDTQRSLMRIVHYDTLGRVVKYAYDNDPSSQNWRQFSYNKKGSLYKEVQYENKEITSYKEYDFDEQNNVTQTRIFNVSEDKVCYKYFYRDTLVYAYKWFSVFTDMNEIQTSEYKVYAFDKLGNLLSIYPMGESPNYINKYHKHLLMASFSLQYPNLDNYVYSYLPDGKLQTVISDNGRRIHFLRYENNALSAYEHYDSYNLVEQKTFIYDANNKLISFIERNSNQSSSQYYEFKYK